MLTSPDSKFVQWFSRDGWRQGDINEQLHGRIADDALLLKEQIPADLRDPEFYGSHCHEVLRNCGEMNSPLMKKIVDGIRRPLHAATMSLAAKFNPEIERRRIEAEEIGAGNVDVMRSQIVAEIESRLETLRRTFPASSE